MKRENHLKGDDVKDPEKAMNRDREKKKKTAMNPFKVSRAEFTAWFVVTNKKQPDWTLPAVAWMFAGWVAGEGERDWLTEEEKVALAKRKEANRKRAETQARKKKEKAEEAAAKKKERKPK